MFRFIVFAAVILIVVFQGAAWAQSEIAGEPLSDIVVVVPYAKASEESPVWAQGEAEIDFRHEPDRAARCTCAFAATELAQFLSQTLPSTTIAYSDSRPESTFFIELKITDPGSRKDGFTIEPAENGVIITGQGRTGLLYGGYELLRMQGWRWYAPGSDGQIAPAQRQRLILPEHTKVFTPSMDLGRGFYLEYVSQASSDLCLWMARNRLNVVGYRPSIGPLSNKLGMIFNNGGHVFEKILDPDRVLPSGQTIWQQHRQWYGLPSDGIRKKEAALETQFCCSQGDLMEFLGEELLKLLMGPWRESDLIEIWGFDTWGSTCTCSQCALLGNSTDQTLHFASAIRHYLNDARADGRLDHEVRLSVCAYEGTNSLEGPEKPFPKNLIAAGDTVVFYPINRCYAHCFYDASCQENSRYRKALQSWFTQTPAMGIYFGEYYNVSKYEDLPVLFTRTMREDIPGHQTAGCRGMTYMHVPFVNWGPRTLTQSLYAQLAWDRNTGTDAFLDAYYKDWYGPFAMPMRSVYDKVEAAWRTIAQWRSWSDTSVLSQLLKWDGKKPTACLSLSEHFQDASQAVENGRSGIGQMEEAIQILNHIRSQSDVSAPYDQRLAEDARSLRYGLNSLELITNVLAYYEALRLGDDPTADAQWARIETLADLLESFWVPMGFAPTGQAGFVCKDALTRTQLRKLIQRCKHDRIADHPPLQP